MSFLLFFLFWIGLLALAHWYIGKRLITPALFRGRRKRLAWLLVGLMFLLPQIPFFLLVNGVESRWQDSLSWAGYVCLGFFSSLLTLVALRDVTLLIRSAVVKAWRLVTRTHNVEPEVDRDRRRLLIHATNIAIIGIAAGATGYGLYEARRRAAVERITVPLANLPGEFDGLRIVQFTDIHVGPTIKREFVEGIAGQLYDLRGDLLAFTGDLVDGSVPWLRDDVAPLRELDAPYGKLFVTGNHEYYSGVDSWMKEAERLGFDVLHNEHRIIQHGGGRIVLAGVTDYGGGDFATSHRSDPSAAVTGAPEGVIKVLLAHQPRSIHAANQAGIDLQISGHTHGGQFFPWNRLATLNQPYIKGLHKHGNTWVYVSRGTGYWGPPLRLDNPPEITVITLKRA